MYVCLCLYIHIYSQLESPKFKPCKLLHKYNKNCHVTTAIVRRRSNPQPTQNLTFPILTKYFMHYSTFP